MRSGRGKVEGDGLLVLVVVCAMVCGRGVRLDGEALASPLSLICAGEAPASEEPRRRGPALTRRLRRAVARRRRRRRLLEATRW